jgi:hypothetical protein
MIHRLRLSAACFAILLDKRDYSREDGRQAQGAIPDWLQRTLASAGLRGNPGMLVSLPGRQVATGRPRSAPRAPHDPLNQLYP